MTTPLDKLREYGYELPPARPPAASYVPVVRTGNTVYISGQISSSDGEAVQGLLGDTLAVEDPRDGGLADLRPGRDGRGRERDSDLAESHGLSPEK